MRNLRNHIRVYESASNSLSELLPWLVLITPAVVLNKDGSLLACFEYEGSDMEGADDADVDQEVMRLEHAMRVFEGRITMWWLTHRRKLEVRLEGEFEDPVARFINEQHQAALSKRSNYANRHYLGILYHADMGADHFFSAVHRYTTKAALSLPAAVLRAAASTLTDKGRGRVDAARVQQQLVEFESLIEQYMAAAPDLRWRRLEKDALRALLHSCASPADAEQGKVHYDARYQHLDASLGGNGINVHQDMLEFEGLNKRYAAAVTIKNWPGGDDERTGGTYPGIFDAILSVPAELTINKVFRFLSQDQARKYIEDNRRFAINWQKSFGQYVKEAVLGPQPQDADLYDKGKREDADKAGSALADLNRGQQFGYCNVTVVAYGNTPEETHTALHEAVKGIQTQGFIALRERLHLLSAWAGTLPGQWGELVRWTFVSVANLADLVDIRSFTTGEQTNAHLSEQAGRHMPALTGFATEKNTPYFFDVHEADLGHFFLVGPTRSGKSVVFNFLESQWKKYAPCNNFTFDKDYSAMIPTLLQGGNYLDLAKGEITLNPCSVLADRNHWPWLADWLEILLTARNHQMMAEDASAVWKAIENTGALPPERHTLSTIAINLPTHLSRQLEQWIGTGPLARYFDNVNDSFTLGHHTAMEMGKLFDQPVVARAFLDYAFHRIEQALDGTPTLIRLEEVWFFLNDAQFCKKIDDYLRTLAKKNTVLGMATQGLDELTRTGIANTIIDSIPTHIFLPNHRAPVHREVYRDKFHLNDTQISMLQTMSPKREYYIRKPHHSRRIQTDFSAAALACLRSDTRALEIFRRHYDRRNENWKQEYIEEVSGHEVTDLTHRIRRDAGDVLVGGDTDDGGGVLLREDSL